MERRPFDVNRFDSDDLAGLPDDQFRALVDADLRQNAARSTIRLRAELSEALRSPDNVRRWYSMLCRMAKSVDGQLAAREADFRGERARLEALALEADDAGRSGLRAQQQRLKAEHHKTKASTVRFKTGLDEVTIVAKFLLEQHLEDLFGAAVLAERDYLAGRCRRLTAAIEQHRDAVMADNAVMDDLGGDDADEIDEALWSVLRSPTENPHERGTTDATDAGPEPRSRRSGSSAERLQLVGSTEA